MDGNRATHCIYISIAKSTKPVGHVEPLSSVFWDCGGRDEAEGESVILKRLRSTMLGHTNSICSHADHIVALYPIAALRSCNDACDIECHRIGPFGSHKTALAR